VLSVSSQSSQSTQKITTTPHESSTPHDSKPPFGAPDNHPNSHQTALPHMHHADHDTARSRVFTSVCLHLASPHEHSLDNAHTRILYYYIYQINLKSHKKALRVRALLARMPSFGQVGDSSIKVFRMGFLFAAFGRKITTTHPPTVVSSILLSSNTYSRFFFANIHITAHTTRIGMLFISL